MQLEEPALLSWSCSRAAVSAFITRHRVAGSIEQPVIVGFEQSSTIIYKL